MTNADKIRVMTDEELADREILFRGKRVDNGEWIEGDLIHLPNGIAILANGYAYIDPETVGQYTGLTDRNGVKIFEGDIVKAYLRNETMMIFPITFRAGCFWFGNWNFIEFLDKFRNIEVIGNIHDNSDLLGGDTNDS